MGWSAAEPHGSQWVVLDLLSPALFVPILRENPAEPFSVHTPLPPKRRDGMARVTSHVPAPG
jgi:hypothetical protein